MNYYASYHSHPSPIWIKPLHDHLKVMKNLKYSRNAPIYLLMYLMLTVYL